jgi:hypothetical protein
MRRQRPYGSAHFVCYIINHDGTAFWVCTVDRPNDTALTFDQRRGFLDQAIATLQFHEPAILGTPSLCTLDQLHAEFGFSNGATSARGSVILTNTSDQACTLQGRPDDVEIVGKQGQLQLTQRAAGGAPSAGLPPTEPIVLQPAAGSDAGVLLERDNWCNGAQGPLSVDIHFAGWRASLEATPATAADSTLTPPCSDPNGQSVLYVDYVRAHDATGFH